MQQAYLELKLAWQLFNKGPDALSAGEKRRVGEVAGRQSAIEQAILASPQSGLVMVPAKTLSTRLAEIRARYDSEEDYVQDIERLGIKADNLAEVVERDLRVEAVLEKVAADIPAPSTIDAEIYYRLHPEAFDRPEARRLRHILITFDSAQEKSKAWKTLENLRLTLKTPEAFAEAALRHSQCPTAMEGGVLGTVKRGQLFAELEPAAFALCEGELSPPTTSPIGLHLLYCEEILPSGLLPFTEVVEQIIERLDDQRRRKAQREWIKQLFAKQA